MGNIYAYVNFKGVLMLEWNQSSLSQAREKTGDQVAIRLSLASDWFSNWCATERIREKLK